MAIFDFLKTIESLPKLISSIDRKIIKIEERLKIMSTEAQLNAAIDQISTQVSEVGRRVLDVSSLLTGLIDRIKEKLEDVVEIDLSDEVASLGQLSASLDTVAGSLTAVGDRISESFADEDTPTVPLDPIAPIEPTDLDEF